MRQGWQAEHVHEVVCRGFAHGNHVIGGQISPALAEPVKRRHGSEGLVFFGKAQWDEIVTGGDARAPDTAERRGTRLRRVDQVRARGPCGAPEAQAELIAQA